MYSAIEHSIPFDDKKPTLLKVSCYLGYFFVSLTIIVGLIMVIVSGAPRVFSMFPELNFYVSLAGGKISMGFALMSLILPVFAFFGIIQLWHQLRIGFWIFVFSKIALIALPFLLVDLSFNELWVFSQPLLIASGILILLFGLNYKKMY